jgi:hypothetical protein
VLAARPPRWAPGSNRRTVSDHHPDVELLLLSDALRSRQRDHEVRAERLRRHEALWRVSIRLLTNVCLSRRDAPYPRLSASFQRTLPARLRASVDSTS